MDVSQHFSLLFFFGKGMSVVPALAARQLTPEVYYVGNCC